MQKERDGEGILFFQINSWEDLKRLLKYWKIRLYVI